MPVQMLTFRLVSSPVYITTWALSTYGSDHTHLPMTPSCLQYLLNKVIIFNLQWWHTLHLQIIVESIWMFEKMITVICCLKKWARGIKLDDSGPFPTSYLTTSSALDQTTASLELYLHFDLCYTLVHFHDYILDNHTQLHHSSANSSHL